jgi:DNA mismatch repair protein MutS2
MDAHSLELLEFQKVRDLLAGYTVSSLGRDLARQIEPGTDPEKIKAELALVSEMKAALGEGQAPPIAGVRDVRLLIRRASIGAMLTAEQLLEIADTLACTGNIFRYRMRLDERFGRLADLLAAVEDLGLVAKSITGCIDPRAQVLDMASPELGQVRQQLAEVDERVQNQIRRLLRNPELRKILRYPNATVSGDHYVLPVAVNHRHKLPGVVHRTSSTGETLFIEPAGVASLSAERAVLKSTEEREVHRVLRRLSGEVARVSRPLAVAIDIIAKVDLVSAKARFSRDYDLVEPHLNADGRLWLPQARHPILEHLFRSETLPAPSDSTGNADVPERRAVVPIDVRLGDEFNLLVITGPNTGGKTVSLKTTGLLCLMAQSGMHIPAQQGCTVPVLDQVLVDIGDEQSLEQSLSTFSSHVSRIATIFRLAGKQSLVLLDELGAGTDPTEGSALGRAILDYLDRIGCLAMVTTHLGDLKTYAFSNKRAQNAAVEFDSETLKPTYRLLLGQFGMSNALKVARRLKLPREVLHRAHRYFRRRQKRAPEMARLQELRVEAEKARQEALQAQHEAERQREEYNRRVQHIALEAQKAAALKELRGRLQPNDQVRVARFDKPGRIVRVDAKRNLALVSVGLGQWEVPLEEIFPL